MTKCAGSSGAPAGRLRQPLAYHPDVRRQVAVMSAELEAARLVTSLGLAQRHPRPDPGDDRGAVPGEIPGRRGDGHITRTALTLGGAHGIFKGSRLEQLFRDGALAQIQPPPADFCLYNMGLYELGLDPDEVLPPMKPG